jgi:hypothetical protein
MEISDVKKRVFETIERAKRTAAERRTRTEEAAREYDAFLNQIAVPLFRQIASVLKAESHMYTVFTPGGSVRLMSDRSGDDYIELTLDTTGPYPQVIGHASRGRGRRVTESERPLGHGGAVRDLTEEDVLGFVMKELEAFVER